MIKRKDRILISAIELLDAEGINGVTTKNLARLQEVTEPALYRQFSSKQDILNHIIEEYSSYDLKISNTIIESNLEGVEAICFYVKRYAELYQNYSELTTVMFSMDLYYYHVGTKKTMEDILKKRISFLEKIIKNSSLKDNPLGFDAYQLASMINGTIFAQVYEWRMSDKSFMLEERLETCIRRLIE